jgi:hypothetical protein
MLDRGAMRKRMEMTPGRTRPKRARYKRDLAHKLYSYFISYNDIGAPSISKFARSIGATVEDVEAWREYELFDRAYRECSEIRRDYLIDSALAKKNDSSLTKFLLSTEFGMGEDVSEGDKSIEVRVEVVD